MQIRNATIKDLPDCVKIMIEAFAGQENWTEKTARARLEEKLGTVPKLCFCLELNKKVVGFMFCEQFDYSKGKYLWVAEFAIDSKHQGKGFGKQALEFIEKFARENKFNVLYLVANKNEKAYKIYQKQGFKDTHQSFMEKEL